MNKSILFAVVCTVLVFSSGYGTQKRPETDATQSPSETLDPAAINALTKTPTPLDRSSGKILHTTGKVIKDEGKDIFITEINREGSLQLTNNSNKKFYFDFPTVSHDGKRVAYVVSKDSGAVYKDFKDTPIYKKEIYIMDINGENQEKISSFPMVAGQTKIDDYLLEIFPAWSHDDKELAFSSNRNLLIEENDQDGLGIYIIDLETFEIKQLTNTNGSSLHPSWSPDGEFITFMSDRAGDWDIYYMRSDGTGKDINITNNKAADRYPSWSNDGKKIIYHSDRDGNLDLYIYDIEKKTEIQLTNSPNNEATARWSPDDNWIAFMSDKDGDYDIYIMNLATKEEKLITNNQVTDELPNWVP